MTPSVDLLPAADLAPYEANARIHTPEAIERLVSIIEEMGWTAPILVDADGVVAGHKRRLAALTIYERGGVIRLPSGEALPQGMVPVIDVSGWSEAQRRAYIIADNQTTLESSWDEGVLRLELEWLSETAEIEMEVTGFSGDMLADILTPWESDIEALESKGAHVEGIVKPITVRVAQEHKPDAIAAIKEALSKLEIEFEL